MAECEKVCRYVDLPLQHASAAVLKRMRRPGNRRTYDTLLARIRAARAGRHAAHDVHRRLPRRDRRRSSPSSRGSSPTPASITSASSPTRTRKARARSPWPTTCRRRLKRRRRNALMARQKRIVAAAQKARIGREVDGPDRRAARRSTSSSLQGRLEGQAPDIDPVVFLTDCDPSDVRRGAPHPGPDRRRAGLRPASPPRSRSSTRPCWDCLGPKSIRLPFLRLARVLYLSVAASSKVTRVGPCPLFVFQACFCLTSAPAACAGGGWGSASGEHRTAGARSGRGGAGGPELRARDLRRPAAARVDRHGAAGRHRPPDPVPRPRRVAEVSGEVRERGGNGAGGRRQRRHRGLPARQPGPERAARRRRRRARGGGARAARTRWKCRRRGSIGRCGTRRTTGASPDGWRRS